MGLSQRGYPRVGARVSAGTSPRSLSVGTWTGPVACGLCLFSARLPFARPAIRLFVVYEYLCSPPPNDDGIPSATTRRHWPQGHGIPRTTCRRQHDGDVIVATGWPVCRLKRPFQPLVFASRKSKVRRSIPHWPPLSVNLVHGRRRPHGGRRVVQSGRIAVGNPWVLPDSVT